MLKYTGQTVDMKHNKNRNDINTQVTVLEGEQILTVTITRIYTVLEDRQIL